MESVEAIFDRERNCLGRRIRFLRLKVGWSQEDLADACGLDRTYVGGIERGERNPSLKNLVKISGALQVGVSELFVLPQEVDRSEP